LRHFQQLSVTTEMIGKKGHTSPFSHQMVWIVTARA
jgi:hypothetical protein